MSPLFDKQTNKGEAVFNAIAHMPTQSLSVLMDHYFEQELTDAEVMRVAVLLAEKSYNEGGCPIGAVIIDNQTRKIVGKGHNTLIQEDHPYNHGETSAMRDAGRIDFSQTSLFTTLSPCDICTTLLYMRGVNRVVIGDITNASGNEALLRDKGVQVDVLEDQKGISLYAKFRMEKPDQDLEDWHGVNALCNHTII